MKLDPLPPSILSPTIQVYYSIESNQFMQVVDTTVQTPDIPENEASRLACLRQCNILDTDPEERFDRLTRVAKRIYDVPMALVSLVDENRQWFKSSQGLSATETPRDISFCGHAILGHEPFVVCDASQDERFADNPLVTGPPNIRFYAGCPLQGPDGSMLGTLCIIDDKPHIMGDEELEPLLDLAHMAEQEIIAIQLATLDELTLISNRRGFMTLAEKYMKLCQRQRLSATLVFIDLNHFKYINDEFGHAEGDRVLIEFSLILQRILRESDLIARLGGDEFVLLLTNATEKDAHPIIEKLTATVMATCIKLDLPYNISFSYGIVEYDSRMHESVDSLLASGDMLMYKHKQQRKCS